MRCSAPLMAAVLSSPVTNRARPARLHAARRDRVPRRSHRVPVWRGKRVRRSVSKRGRSGGDASHVRKPIQQRAPETAILALSSEGPPRPIAARPEPEFSVSAGYRSANSGNVRFVGWICPRGANARRPFRYTRAGCFACRAATALRQPRDRNRGVALASALAGGTTASLARSGRLRAVSWRALIRHGLSLRTAVCRSLAPRERPCC